MNSKYVFTIVAFVFAFAISAMAQDADSKYATNLLKPGTEAPDFTLNDLNGKSHKLSSLRGNYVVLDFWASWCSDCRKDMPEMKRLYERYGKEVQFVGISFDDKKENWEKYVQSNELKWLQVSELKKWKDTGISKAYNISWLPTMYVLDREGKVVLSTVMIEKVAAKLEEEFVPAS